MNICLLGMLKDYITCLDFILRHNTDGSRILHTLLVKHYNGLLYRQSSEWGKDEVTYFYVGDVFVYTLGLSMPIFKKKSPWRFLGKSSKLWVLHKNDFLCNTQSSELFPRNLCEDFFLKISILTT